MPIPFTFTVNVRFRMTWGFSVERSNIRSLVRDFPILAANSFDGPQRPRHLPQQTALNDTKKGKDKI
jgi:hypothetical protein